MMQRAAAALVLALLLDGEGQVRPPRPVLSSLLAIAVTLVLLVVAFAVDGFALWYTGDQQEI